jgi:hypothetical protein
MEEEGVVPSQGNDEVEQTIFDDDHKYNNEYITSVWLKNSSS